MNIDIADTMVRTAMDSMRNAYALYDGIIAGACALASDGTLYSGCTIDHPIPEYNFRGSSHFHISNSIRDARKFRKFW